MPPFSLPATSTTHDGHSQPLQATASAVPIGEHIFGDKMYSSAFPSSRSSRAGLGAPAACSRHIGTSPCVMGQMFGGCVVEVCYHAEVCAGSPI